MARKIFKPNIFDRLEKEGNDDFALFQEFGADQFGTEHLREMRDQAKEQLEFFGKKLRLSMIIGGLSAGWIFLGLLLMFFRFPNLGLASLGVGAICLTTFMTMTVVLYKNYGSKGDWEHFQRQIESELRHRANQVQKY